MFQESPTIFYTVYKTTNLINGKFYIGKHQTKVLNDGYMGSGKLINHAFKKYGIENFSFEYLGIYDQEWKMNIAEKIYVVLDLEVSYNLCPGGQGGFGYINKNGLGGTKGYSFSEESKLKISKKLKGRIFTEDHRTKISISNTGNKKVKTFLGKKHSQETKNKISETNKSKLIGNKNPRFGKCWITNDIISLVVPIEDLSIWLDKDYRKGRIMKPK